MKPKVIFRKKQRKGKKVKEGWEEGRKAGMESRKEQNSYIIVNLDWRREWNPTPVFLPVKSLGPGKSGRLQSMASQRVGTRLSY